MLKNSKTCTAHQYRSRDVRESAQKKAADNRGPFRYGMNRNEV